MIFMDTFEFFVKLCFSCTSSTTYDYLWPWLGPICQDWIGRWGFIDLILNSLSFSLSVCVCVCVISRSFLVACLQWIIVLLQALIFLLALLVRAANRPVEYDSDDELIAPRQQNRQPLLNRPPAPATGVPVAGTLDQRPSRNDAWSTRMREKVWLFLNFNAVKVWRTIWQFCMFLWPCSHLSHTFLGIHLMWYSFTKLFIINGFSLSLWKFRFLTFV